MKLLKWSKNPQNIFKKIKMKLWNLIKPLKFAGSLTISGNDWLPFFSSALMQPFSEKMEIWAHIEQKASQRMARHIIKDYETWRKSTRQIMNKRKRSIFACSESDKTFRLVIRPLKMWATRASETSARVSKCNSKLNPKSVTFFLLKIVNGSREFTKLFPETRKFQAQNQEKLEKAKANATIV